MNVARCHHQITVLTPRLSGQYFMVIRALRNFAHSYYLREFEVQTPFRRLPGCLNLVLCSFPPTTRISSLAFETDSFKSSMPPARLTLYLLGARVALACAGSISPLSPQTDPCSSLGGKTWVSPQDVRACMLAVPFDKRKQENVRDCFLF